MFHYYYIYLINCFNLTIEIIQKDWIKKKTYDIHLGIYPSQLTFSNKKKEIQNWFYFFILFRVNWKIKKELSRPQCGCMCLYVY